MLNDTFLSAVFTGHDKRTILVNLLEMIVISVIQIRNHLNFFFWHRDGFNYFQKIAPYQFNIAQIAELSEQATLHEIFNTKKNKLMEQIVR